jgi:uncharacterized damage-inducible protein DinB
VPPPERHVLTVPTRSRAREIASFLAQLDDQSRRLRLDTRGLTRPALEWQPAPGMNTIGMLLAHIAVVEVVWMQVGPLGLARPDSLGPLGIGVDDDGIPLPARAQPPRALAGRTLGFYDDLLARARAHTREAASRLTDADLDREFTRKRRDGLVRVLNLRWVFYHVLEHLAGHYGQVLLLRHQIRAQVRPEASRRNGRARPRKHLARRSG